MGLLDDYVDEMDALSPDQVEAVLAGRAAREPVAARAAALVEDLRRALPEEPAPEVAERHLAAMGAAAEEVGLTRSRRPRRRVLITRRMGGLALAATFLLGGGLAAAVTLPEEADEQAWEAVDPGPEAVQEASAHGEAVTEAVTEVAQDPSLGGCEKGQAVAEVASSKAAEHRQNPADGPDPCAQGEDEKNGSVSGNGQGEEASAFGKQTASEAKSDGRGFGEQTASEAQEDGAGFGQDTAGEASGGTPGGDPAQEGLETAQEHSGGVPEGAPTGLPEGPPGP